MKVNFCFCMTLHIGEWGGARERQSGLAIIFLIKYFTWFVGDHYSMVTLLNDNVDVNIRGMK